MAINEATIEYPETFGAEEMELSDEEIEKQIEQAGQMARVSPLDPDFIAFALPLALIFDLIGAIVGILVLLSLLIAEPIWLGVDFVFMSIIGGWVYWRTNKIAQSRQEMRKSLEKSIKRTSATFKRQVAKLAMKFPSKRIFFRLLLRCGVCFLGKAIPIISIIPFYTITVIMTLREK